LLEERLTLTNTLAMMHTPKKKKLKFIVNTQLWPSFLLWIVYPVKCHELWCHEIQWHELASMGSNHALGHNSMPPVTNCTDLTLCHLPFKLWACE
jgi:hypothetical protein